MDRVEELERKVAALQRDLADQNVILGMHNVATEKIRSATSDLGALVDELARKVARIEQNIWGGKPPVVVGDLNRGIPPVP